MANNTRNIQIEYSEAQIRSMPDSEKLNLLVEIGLVNHRELFMQGQTLYGDDKAPGICEKIRAQAQQVNFLWVALSTATGSLGTIICWHIFK